VPDLQICPNGGTLHAMRDGEALAQLAPGESFAVLEVAGDWVWGYRQVDGQVGYLRQSAFERSEV
jgi:hypothetical protein